jgi:sugar lactone lactonase YvrE
MLGAVEFPHSKSVSAVCFGGHDLNDLYVTTAKLFDPDSSNAGSLWVVRGVRSHLDGRRVRGLPGREVAANVVRGQK